MAGRKSLFKKRYGRFKKAQVRNAPTIHVVDAGGKHFHYWNNSNKGGYRFVDKDGNPLFTEVETAEGVKRKLIGAVRVTAEWIKTELPKLQDEGDITLSELAHFRPKTRKSKAQYLTATEILDLRDDIELNGGCFLLAHQDCTPNYLDRFRKLYNFPDAEKGDSYDPIYMYVAVMARPHIINSWRQVPERHPENDELSFDPPQRVKNGRMWKDKVTANLNWARTEAYSINFIHQKNEEFTDYNTEWLLDNFNNIGSQLTPRAVRMFGFDAAIKNAQPEYPMYIANRGKPEEYARWHDERGGFNHVAILTIIGCFRNAETGAIWVIRKKDGTLALPDNNFIRSYLLGFRERRKQSGTARSSIMQFSCMRYMKQRAEEEADFSLMDGRKSKYIHQLEDEQFELVRLWMNDHRRDCMNVVNVVKPMLLEEIANGAEYEVLIDMAQSEVKDNTTVCN